MDEEMQSLLGNSTWVLEPTLPFGAHVIPVKWIYKLKRGSDGQVQRFKAWLVAKGFKQVPGVDFNEIYAPVSKHATLRALLAITAMEDLELNHLDVKTAFLNGDLDEVIYMQQPPGYVTGSPGTTCRLLKSLYGLRQAPRAWHLKLKSTLETLGYTPTASDPGIYVSKRPEGNVYLGVYVDDILPAAKTPAVQLEVKEQLSAIFDIRDLGPASHFLGMRITRDRPALTLKIDQATMTKDLILKFSLSDAKFKSIPADPDSRLSAAVSDSEILDPALYPYAELVGSLLYLSVVTRPDISYSVGVLSRYMSKPTLAHWNAAKAVLRYLASTPEYGIVYSPSPGPSHSKSLLGFCDADYAGDLDTRRSTTGYMFTLHSGAISWNSRLQPTVAVSTAEAEYMAAAAAVKEALWLRTLLSELGVCSLGPVTLLTDNQASLSLLKHPISSQRSKHIDVIHHFARERVTRGEVVFHYIPTADMTADIMTKPLALPKFKHFRSLMGVKQSLT